MIRTCKECGKEFTITGGEIRFYKSKHLQFPRRCKECRGKGKKAMKANGQIVILYASSHHENTRKVVEAMKDACGALLIDVKKDQIPDLSEIKAIGVATGIFASRPDEDIVKAFSGLKLSPAIDGFIVTTSGSGKDYSKPIRKLMDEKHIGNAGCFYCKGFCTFGPFKLLGGLSKGHPDDIDLTNAKEFAKRLAAKYQSVEGEADA